MSERIGDWIQTYTGVAFYPMDPRPEEISIVDIAHALSMQCRYTGHVKSFYSVAEHSVRVSMLCDPADALAGLLHDGSEAYLIDVPRPLKRMPMMSFYRETEAALQKAIYRRFGIEDEPDSVKAADQLMLGIEVRDMMQPLTNPEKWEWCLAPARNHPMKLTRNWSPGEAEDRFLAAFVELRAPFKTSVTVAEAASIMGRHAAQGRRKAKTVKGEPLFTEAA